MPFVSKANGAGDQDDEQRHLARCDAKTEQGCDGGIGDEVGQFVPGLLEQADREGHGAEIEEQNNGYREQSYGDVSHALRWIVDVNHGLASSYPVIDVLEAHDVIFFEIGAGLNFNHLQGDFSGILKSMRDANRDVG